jgi:cytochrome d ubiquinol oxidase subunit II
VAAAASAQFPTDPKAGFYAWYIAPWNTAFGWTTGLFVCALFAFEGAALLSSEQALHGLPLPYVSIARATHVLSIGLGALVFLLAYVEHLPWFTQLIHSPWALGALALATSLIPSVAKAFDRGRPWRLRAAMFVQVSCILFGFFAGQFPVLLRLDDRVLRYQDAAAPDATLRTLIVALIVGLAVILPGLAFLIHVYKGSADETAHDHV